MRVEIIEDRRYLYRVGTARAGPPVTRTWTSEGKTYSITTQPDTPVEMTGLACSDCYRTAYSSTLDESKRFCMGHEPACSDFTKKLAAGYRKTYRLHNT